MAAIIQSGSYMSPSKIFIMPELCSFGTLFCIIKKIYMMVTRIYELLSRVTFDDLIPTLKQILKMDESIIEGQLPYYKGAFDELCMTKPIVSDKHIEVSSTDGFISVRGCQDYWNKVLGKLINLEEGLIIPDCELSAHILWEITYFGFSEGAYGRYSPREENIYRRRIMKILDKETNNYSRKEDWANVGGMKYIPVHRRMAIDRRKYRRNRAKRMRDARQSRQIERLRKLALREEGICRAVATGCITRNEIDYIINVPAGEEHTYHSVTRNIDGRADYMIELITKYSEIDFAMYDSAVVIVTSSPDHPVTLDEKRIIDDCFGKIGFDRGRIIRFGEDASILNHHLKMQLILTNGA